ncbi:unnamed protein product [Rhizopus stolonifer]
MFKYVSLSASVHTSVFNTIHIIAAVLGVVGSIAVGLSIFFICKRKRKRKDLDNQTEKKTNHQFASDFETTESPMMQQHQLQIKLQHTHSSVTFPPPPYLP